MNQRSNSVQFFKCNDLVTEKCLFLSFTDSHLSMPYHYATKIMKINQKSMSFLIGNLSLGTFDIELIPGCLIPSLCFIQHDFIKSSVYFKSLGNIYFVL